MKTEINIFKENGSIEIEYKGYRIDKYKLLAMAINSEQTEQSLELLKIASVFKGEETFDTLYFATINTVTDRRMTESKEPNEFYYQKLFNTVYPNMANVKVIDVKHDGENIPDSWVLKGENKIPVEVKKYDFDKKALMQLKRYMRIYQSKYGIAVAKSLTVDIPDNITFVSINDLEKFHTKI